MFTVAGGAANGLANAKAARNKMIMYGVGGIVLIVFLVWLFSGGDDTPAAAATPLDTCTIPAESRLDCTAQGGPVHCKERGRMCSNDAKGTGRWSCTPSGAAACMVGCDEEKDTGSGLCCAEGNFAVKETVDGIEHVECCGAESDRLCPHVDSWESKCYTPTTEKCCEIDDNGETPGVCKKDQACCGQTCCGGDSTCVDMNGRKSCCLNACGTGENTTCCAAGQTCVDGVCAVMCGHGPEPGTCADPMKCDPKTELPKIKASGQDPKTGQIVCAPPYGCNDVNDGADSYSACFNANELCQFSFDGMTFTPVLRAVDWMQDAASGETDSAGDVLRVEKAKNVKVCLLESELDKSSELGYSYAGDEMSFFTEVWKPLDFRARDNQNDSQVETYMMEWKFPYKNPSDDTGEDAPTIDDRCGPSVCINKMYVNETTGSIKNNVSGQMDAIVDENGNPTNKVQSGDFTDPNGLDAVQMLERDKTRVNYDGACVTDINCNKLKSFMGGSEVDGDTPGVYDPEKGQLGGLGEVACFYLKESDDEKPDHVDADKWTGRVTPWWDVDYLDDASKTGRSCKRCNDEKSGGETCNFLDNGLHCKWGSHDGKHCNDKSNQDGMHEACWSLIQFDQPEDSDNPTTSAIEMRDNLHCYYRLEANPLDPTSDLKKRIVDLDYELVPVAQGGTACVSGPVSGHEGGLQPTMTSAQGRFLAKSKREDLTEGRRYDWSCRCDLVPGNEAYQTWGFNSVTGQCTKYNAGEAYRAVKEGGKHFKLRLSNDHSKWLTTTEEIDNKINGAYPFHWGDSWDNAFVWKIGDGGNTLKSVRAMRSCADARDAAAATNIIGGLGNLIFQCVWIDPDNCDKCENIDNPYLSEGAWGSWDKGVLFLWDDPQSQYKATIQPDGNDFVVELAGQYLNGDAEKLLWDDSGKKTKVQVIPV